MRHLHVGTTFPNPPAEPANEPAEGTQDDRAEGSRPRCRCLSITLIDGDHVTLAGAGPLHDPREVAERLTALTLAGVRHVTVDARLVTQVDDSVIHTISDLTDGLDAIGGRLEIVNARPGLLGRATRPTTNEPPTDPGPHQEAPC